MEFRKALADLADAAERFVNKAPNQTRLETEEERCLMRSGRRNCFYHCRLRTARQEAGKASRPAVRPRGDQRSGSPSKSRVQQDAEKVRQRRSRIVQTLNVPQRVRLGPSLAAALLDGLFEHPAGVFPCCATRAVRRISCVPQ